MVDSFTYSCVIVDDNEFDRLVLQDYLQDYPEIKLLQTFSKPVEALAYIRAHRPDIIFLDVSMPEQSGLEMRQQLLNVPVCIFVTDYPDHAVQSFELEALDYLLKPVKEKRFEQTIKRIKTHLERLKSEDHSVFIKEGHTYKRIVVDEILYIKALQNYSVLHTTRESFYRYKMISHLLDEPYFDDFIRVHRSYAVNKKHVLSASSKEITLSDQQTIPVGRKYKDVIYQYLQ